MVSRRGDDGVGAEVGGRTDGCVAGLAFAPQRGRSTVMVYGDDKDPGQVVRSRIGIARWLAEPRSAEDCRPSLCPRCGAATYAHGRRVALHGHGFRQRVVMWMEGARIPPRRVVLRARRFVGPPQCGGACLVVPREVLPHRRYTASAIGALIAREAEVQAQPWMAAASCGPRRPQTARRWVRKGLAPIPTAWSTRARLARLAAIIAGAGPAERTGGLAGAAFAGALTMCDLDRTVTIRLGSPHQLRALGQQLARNHLTPLANSDAQATRPPTHDAPAWPIPGGRRRVAKTTLCARPHSVSAGPTTRSVTPDQSVRDHSASFLRDHQT